MNSKPKTIEGIIRILEHTLVGTAPGTVISRIITVDGMAWSVGIGAMNCPKRYFIHKDLKKALIRAKKWVDVSST